MVENLHVGNVAVEQAEVHRCGGVSPIWRNGEPVAHEQIARLTETVCLVDKRDFQHVRRDIVPRVRHAPSDSEGA